MKRELIFGLILVLGLAALPGTAMARKAAPPCSLSWTTVQEPDGTRPAVLRVDCVPSHDLGPMELRVKLPAACALVAGELVVKGPGRAGRPLSLEISVGRAEQGRAASRGHGPHAAREEGAVGPRRGPGLQRPVGRPGEGPSPPSHVGRSRRGGSRGAGTEAGAMTFLLRPSFTVACLLLALFVLSGMPLGAAELVEQSVTPSVTAIPDDDANGLTSQVTVTAPGKIIADLRLEVDITHSYSGDLRILLRGPDGTEVLLYDRSGGSVDDVAATFGGATFTPESLLAFNGKSLDGVWTLVVSDHAALDTGTLDGWRLEATTYESGGSALATGRFLYEDYAVTTSGYASPTDRGVRRAEVQVIRSSDGLVLGSGITGDDGSYSVTVASDGTTEVLVRVLSKAVSDRSAAVVLDTLTSQQVYAIQGGASSRDTASAMDFGELVGTRGDGLAGPFNILDRGVACGGDRLGAHGGRAPRGRLPLGSHGVQRFHGLPALPGGHRHPERRHGPRRVRRRRDHP